MGLVGLLVSEIKGDSMPHFLPAVSGTRYRTLIIGLLIISSCT